MRFLIGGGNTFKAMAEAFQTTRNSTHCILILGWTLDVQVPIGADQRPLFNVLSERASNGVQVRALIWNKPGLGSSQGVERLNRLVNCSAQQDAQTLQFGSHHQKIVIVNGTQGLIAFCGGVDFDPSRLAATDGGLYGFPMHDVHCEIRGPAAFDLLQVFERRWQQALASDTNAVLRWSPGSRIPPPAQILVPPNSHGLRSAFPASVCIAQTMNYTHTGGLADRSYRSLILAAIRNARRFIYVEDQYLTSTDAALALRAVTPRLQHITMLTNRCDALMRWPRESRSLMLQLAAIGAATAPSSLTLGPTPQAMLRIPPSLAAIVNATRSDLFPPLPCANLLRRQFTSNLYNRLSRRDQQKIRIVYRGSSRNTVRPGDYVHSKVWIFDDELAVIGSANCNNRGWSHDSEVAAFVFDAASPSSPHQVTFAQALRLHLWSLHLGLPPADLADGVASARQWLHSNRVTRRELRDEMDTRQLPPGLCSELFMSTFVDPRA